MFYKEKLQTRIDDFDIKGQMLPGGLLKTLENLSDHHARTLLDQDAEKTAGYTWVLSEWRIEIRRVPQYKEELEGQTWVNTASNSARMVRDFQILTPEGDILVEAEAKVAIFDMVNSRLVRIDPELRKLFDLEEKNLFPVALSKKAVMPEAVECSKELQLRRADVDYNLHVHNTVYLDLAMEVLPTEFDHLEKIVGMHLIYKTPVFLQQKVEAVSAPPSTETEIGKMLHKVGIYADGQLCSTVEIFAN